MNKTERSAQDVLQDTATLSLLICAIHENQRPLKGVAGELDWRLGGFLSRFVIAGRISGAKSEFTYIPISRNKALRHLLLVGLGTIENAETETGDKILKTLAKTVHDLKFSKIAISRSSFPSFADTNIKKAFKGIDVEFIQ